MQCVNKNTREYQTLLKQSGLSDFELQVYVGESLDTLGRYPYLDELLNANSSKAISKDLSLNKDNVTKTENILKETNTNTVEEAIPVLNNRYRDKEIEVLEVGSRSKVYVTTRPNESGNVDLSDEIEIEMKNIKEKAVSNGTYMTAPNGNPTNLNERQWLQVRTQAFKQWFGNWENDSKNSSKVVDKNGEPLVVYRIDGDKFNIFDRSYIGTNLEPYFGKGFYFTPSFEYASIFPGTYIRGFFLNAKKEYNIKDSQDQKLIDLEKTSDSVNWIKEKGKEEELVVFNPNQIKSADNNSGRFSSINDDITDNEVNSFCYFNEVIDKLQTLYGINIIPITNEELSKDSWASVVGTKSVKSFIYNGNIYINTDIATVDSPVHEFLHLLFGSMKYQNRTLYDQLVSQAEQFDSYNTISLNYPNRTKGDINEEVFVTELAKYLTGQNNAINNLSDANKKEIMYNINRTLDTVLMGEHSVKSVQDPYNFSLKSLAKLVNSSTMVAEKRGSLTDATINRMMANTKSELMKNRELREECQ